MTKKQRIAELEKKVSELAVEIARLQEATFPAPVVPQQPWPVCPTWIIYPPRPVEYYTITIGDNTSSTKG